MNHALNSDKLSKIMKENYYVQRDRFSNSSMEKRRLGFNKGSGGHWKLMHPRCLKPVFISGTPSDWRAIRNIEAFLKRSINTIT